MTYASTCASFTGRTSATSGVSKPLHVFTSRKRGAPPTSRKQVKRVSHNFVEARTEVPGMEDFQQMFLASRPRFIAMAHAILRNREDAEDAVQNAFLSGHLHLRSFEGRSALTTWFTRVVLNAALMIRRKRKSFSNPTQETSTFDEAGWMQTVSSSEPDPEMVYAEQETLQFVNGVLAKMRPALRQAFTMIYYDELSGPEACALLGVPAGTFKARLFRARRQLLNQAQRALVAPIHRANRSSSFPDRSAVQHLVARPLDTSSLEASYS